MNVSIEKALQQLDGLILGKQAVLRQLLACILAGGHVLLEDVPGVGKTTLAHALAAVLGLAGFLAFYGREVFDWCVDAVKDWKRRRDWENRNR